MKLLKKRNGEFLSTEYINITTKYDWKCANGHTFSATLGNVKGNNSWCPYCLYKSEQACREILENIFCRPFVKCKPKFLNGLELDGYCQRLQLAFEYNGTQHERFDPFFHDTEEKFKRQLERDHQKHFSCIENDIYLLHIPSMYTYRNVTKMKEFIVNELKYAGYID